MIRRVSIGALGCALFIAAPAWAQPPAETTTTESAEVPAATSGPAVVDEHPTPAPEPAPVVDTYAAAPPPEADVEPKRDEEHRGFELALRVAYGIPLGDAVGEDFAAEERELSDTIKGQIPLQLDLGYRINNHLLIGAYGSYGFGFKPDACDDLGIECDSPSQVRVGGQIIYNILPVTHFMSPWIGAGIGYEWLNSPREDVSFDGMEFFNVQAGLDFRVADHMRVGPYAMFSLGQYSSRSLGDADIDIDDQGTHEWLSFGLKATFGAFGGD